MAVYKRNYRPYEGALTPQWSRFLILPRYAFQDLFASRGVTALFVASFVPTLFAGLTIYLRYNATAVEKLGISLAELLPIDNTFFLYLLYFQGAMAFFMTVLTGPGLVSPDLNNNALPLYLCRPFNRTDYVLGKMSVLLILLSLITWMPGLLLYLFNASLAGPAWFYGNLDLAGAIFLSGALWVVILSLLSLAVSAWVRWKPIAGILLFGIMGIAAVFANILFAVLDARRAKLLDLPEVVWTIWNWLFQTGDGSIPVGEAWLSVLALCLFCLWILNRKIRAYEVVR